MERSFPSVDGHVGLDMVLGVESPVTDSALK